MSCETESLDKKLANLSTSEVSALYQIAEIFYSKGEHTMASLALIRAFPRLLEEQHSSKTSIWSEIKAQLQAGPSANPMVKALAELAATRKFPELALSEVPSYQATKRQKPNQKSVAAAEHVRNSLLETITLHEDHLILHYHSLPYAEKRGWEMCAKYYRILMYKQAEIVTLKMLSTEYGVSMSVTQRSIKFTLLKIQKHVRELQKKEPTA